MRSTRVHAKVRKAKGAYLNNRESFWAGVRAEVPLLIGVFPFGMIYGALAMNAGLSKLTSQMMSSIVFAGSSQFVTAQLLIFEKRKSENMS